MKYRFVSFFLNAKISDPSSVTDDNKPRLKLMWWTKRNFRKRASYLVAVKCTFKSKNPQVLVLKAQIDAKMQENNYDCTHFLNFNKSENSLFNCEMLIFMNFCLSPRFEYVSHNWRPNLGFLVVNVCLFTPNVIHYY